MKKTLKLVCLIVGEETPFEVVLDNTASVSSLSEKIKEKNPDTITCDANELKLYVAWNGQKWLYRNEKNEFPEDLNEFKKTVMIAEDGIEDCFNDQIPVKNVVHVLVEIPVMVNHAFTCLTRDVKEELKVVVSEVFGEIKSKRLREYASEVTRAIKAELKIAVSEVFDEKESKKRPEYSISKCSQEEAVLQAMNLSYDFLVYDELENLGIGKYQWLETQESNVCNRTQYKQYMEENLADVFYKDGVQQYFLEDTAGTSSLLSLNDTRLPIVLKGTVDFVIVDRVAKLHKEIFAGLRLIIEVKKDASSGSHHAQALMELISADFKSFNRAPVGLLTDLRDNWFFMWFSDKKKITKYTLQYPSNAFNFIKQILQEPVVHQEENDFYDFAIPFVEKKPKRKKLSDMIPMPNDGSAELLERYELMADELEPEFLQSRRIEYMQNLVTKMPLYSYMYSSN